MLRHGRTGKDLPGYDQYLRTSHRKLFQQPLGALLKKYGVQIQAARHRFLHQVQTFHSDMVVRRFGAAGQTCAQFFNPGILPAFHPPRTMFCKRFHTS